MVSIVSHYLCSVVFYQVCCVRFVSGVLIVKRSIGKTHHFFLSRLSGVQYMAKILLQESVCVICPVTNGSKIKI